MKKYTKHYIKYRLEDDEINYSAGEIENSNVCNVINAYGNNEILFRKNLAGFADSFDMIAFCLYDVHFIEDEGICYSSGNTNVRWVYFGKRVSILEYDKFLHYIKGDRNADSFCKIGNIFYALGPNDMVFDEYVDEYYNELEKINLKVIR